MYFLNSFLFNNIISIAAMLLELEVVVKLTQVKHGAFLYVVSYTV